MALSDAAHTATIAHLQVSERTRRTEIVPQIWTTARCHRLLRPLQSRIIALRRVMALDAAKTDSTSGISSSILAKRPSQSCSHSTERQKKRPRRTYSQKGPFKYGSPIGAVCTLPRGSRQLGGLTKHGHHSAKLSFPEIAPPVLRRALVPNANSPDSRSGTPYKQQTGEGSRYASRRIRRTPESSIRRLEALRQLLPLGQWRAYEAIMHDMDVLLRSTAIVHDGPSPKSLMSMCLRKVPEYVKLVENWDERESARQGVVSMIDCSTPSVRVYDSLETLGCAGTGWKHLRAVVRAHAISIIKDAISEGLLDIYFTEILAQQCNNLGYAAGATELVESLINRSYHDPRSIRSTLTDESRLGALSVLIDVGEWSKNMSCVFRSISALLSASYLSEAWLYTRAFASVWTAAASALMEEQVNVCAVEFTSHAIALLCLASSSTMEKWPSNQGGGYGTGSSMLALINVVGEITAMAMVSRESTDVGINTSDERERSKISRRVLYILQSAATASSNASGNDFSSAYLLMLAFYLLCHEENVPNVADDARTILLATWASRAMKSDSDAHSCTDLAQVYDMTVALICSIAHSCGRASSNQANLYLSKLCDLLATLGLQSLQAVRTDSACLLAQKTGDLRDLLFAENFTQGTTKWKTHTGSTESSEALFSGYRWEPGISEWVVISPAQVRSSGRPRDDQRNTSDGGKTKLSPLDGAIFARSCAAESIKTNKTRAVHSQKKQQKGNVWVMRHAHERRGSPASTISQTDDQQKELSSVDELDGQQQYQYQEQENQFGLSGVCRNNLRVKCQGTGPKERRGLRVTLGVISTVNMEMQSEDELGI